MCKLKRNSVVCGNITLNQSQNTTCGQKCRIELRKNSYNERLKHGKPLTKSDLHELLGGKCIICNSTSRLNIHHLGYIHGDTREAHNIKRNIDKDPNRFTCLCYLCNMSIEWYYDIYKTNSLDTAKMLLEQMKPYRANGIKRDDVKAPKRYCEECNILLTNPRHTKRCGSKKCHAAFEKKREQKRKESDITKKLFLYPVRFCVFCHNNMLKLNPNARHLCKNYECWNRRKRIIIHMKDGFYPESFCMFCHKYIRLNNTRTVKLCSATTCVEKINNIMNKKPYKICTFCHEDIRLYNPKAETLCYNPNCKGGIENKQIIYNKNSFCRFCHANTHPKHKHMCSDSICGKKRRDIRSKIKKTDGGTVDIRCFCRFCHNDIRLYNPKAMTRCHNLKCKDKIENKQIIYNKNSLCILCRKNIYHKHRKACSDLNCEKKRRAMRSKIKRMGDVFIDLARFCIFCHENISINQPSIRKLCRNSKCITKRKRAKYKIKKRVKIRIPQESFCVFCHENIHLYRPRAKT